MSTHLIIDKAGRVVIPKSVREELRLEAGDALEMESGGEAITLRPVRGTAPLKKEHGVWVFYAEQPLAASLPTKRSASFARNATWQTLATTNEGVLRYVGTGGDILRGPCSPPGKPADVYPI